MSRLALKRQRFDRRCRGVRKGIMGTPQRPRLAVFRSLRHIYAQIVDDLSGRTLASASSLKMRIASGNREQASQVGRALAEAAVAAGVRQVVLDRRGYRYHGRVQALADAAREGGLEF